MANDEEQRNYLRIQSSKFALELEGDPHFILETYDNVRQDILKRLIELIRLHPDGAVPASGTPLQPKTVAVDKPSLEELAQRNAPNNEEPAQPPLDPNQEANYVWVYVTHEIYNKVYVVDLNTFLASPLSRFFDGRRLRRIYLNRDSQGLLGPLVGTGKTLWSELTKKGREQLADSGRE